MVESLLLRGPKGSCVPYVKWLPNCSAGIIRIIMSTSCRKSKRKIVNKSLSDFMGAAIFLCRANYIMDHQSHISPIFEP